MDPGACAEMPSSSSGDYISQIALRAREVREAVSPRTRIEVRWRARCEWLSGKLLLSPPVKEFLEARQAQKPYGEMLSSPACRSR